MDSSTARKRQHLLQQMEQIEHMETGALTEELRTRTVDGVEVTFGPYFKHQQWKDGRNCSRRIPPEQATALREAIDARRFFEQLAEQFVELTVAATRAQAALPESKKKLQTEVREAQFTETTTFLRLARDQMAQGGGIDLGALEMGLRTALLKDGCELLQDLLRHAATLCDRTCRPSAEEKVYHQRPRTVETVLGEVQIFRDYFHCQQRCSGHAPFDETLGLIEGYSPGLARLMCRIAAQQSYELAAADLWAYAGVKVEGRAIQRMANLVGPQMRMARSSQPEPAQPKAVPVMYVSADGTGVPMMRPELEGRKGRQPDGSARTREAKLGCVFTQQSVDAEGHPLRDPASTTYIGTLQNAADFGLQLRQEAIRRGLGAAKKIVFLGDGAAWVWEQARINFPAATCILDFYHAYEHLGELCIALEGKGVSAQKRTARWAKSMKKGGIAKILTEAQKLMERSAAVAPEETAKQIEYFRKNEHRMRYGHYQREHLFIGSGVVEAGCRTVIGQRLKKSGMFWSQPGAQNVIDLRSALLGGHFDSDWNILTAPLAA